LFNLAKKVTLALTSDLFAVLLPLLRRTKSDFLEEAMTFQEKLLLFWGKKTAKLAKSSEMTVQKNNLRGCDP
jgi:hypothetical protein